MEIPSEAEYELFCLADPDFYEQPDFGVSEERLFPAVREAATPAGWRRRLTAGWVNYQPPGVRIPTQGWKIHVSAAIGQAEEVVQKVFDYCVGRVTTFKLVPGSREHHRRNAKYADRAGSGKLATIYPRDERQLETLVRELGDLLRGVSGPYILSDLRWMDGPVYVRYGAFQARTVATADGREVLAVEDADGNLVPDARGPVFSVPEWISMPEFLRPHLARRNATHIDDLPVEFVGALHYSNGGGVYEGREKDTGAKVVIKEARPHAGLDGARRDAVTRLRRERDFLERLRGLPGVPALMGYHSVADYEFLVEEFIEGLPLYKACAIRNPLLSTVSVGRREVDEYRRWAMALWQSVADAVRLMHDRGVVFGDLHMSNVLYSAEREQVYLIDFEGGWFVAEDGRQLMASTGFAAPPRCTGTEVDEYALAALKLAVFAPLTATIPMNRGKAAHLARVIGDRFGVPEKWLAGAVAVLGEGARPWAPIVHVVSDPGAKRWPAVRASIAAGIRASATPERNDRLFPGDIAQFTESGAELSMAYGAAGVLWALRRTGENDVEGGERWLLDRMQDRRDIPPGFYNGRHGIAYALWDLGRREAALETLNGLLEHEANKADVSLFSGLSGMGLNWLHFARESGEDRYLGRALRIADSIRDRLEQVTDIPETSGGGQPYAGLMHGSSGPALFLTAAFEETGDIRYLDAAETALRQDLRRCIRDEEGTLQVNEGFRRMPYLAGGSAGIGIVLDRYLACRPDSELEADLAAILQATRSSLYLLSGLFHGTAGMVLCNASHGSGDAQVVAEQVAGLDWQVLDWRGHIAFPGSHSLRLSMDLATGSAGVLLALAAAQAATTEPKRRLSLPFLLPATEREVRRTSL
ncbi:class III lanthionine synthetase LanKC [Nonomuraea sp. NPDC003707]